MIQLAERIVISSFALSHISSHSAPLHRLRSAPEHFQVWALSHESDLEGHLLGTYTYHLSANDPLQFFPVQNPLDTPVDLVELRILSNHGLEDYTCVYRFKVFGQSETGYLDDM